MQSRKGKLMSIHTTNSNWQGALGALMRHFGQTSDSIRLGFQRGFDSGEMMDRIYHNQPSGRYGVGQFMDWVYLNQIGCKGLRGRKHLLKAALRQAIDEQRALGKSPVIVDVASGPATYLVEALAEDGGSNVQAICRDLDKNGLHRGRELASRYGLGNVRYEHANALDAASLSAVHPRPTIAVSSGFYEILLDDELIQRSMQLIHDLLPPDGVFIFTTQVNHPQLKLIAALPNRDGQPWIMKNRSVSLVEGWARVAGFSNVKTALEPHGLFSVSVATI